MHVKVRVGVRNKDCVCWHEVKLCQTNMYSAHTHGLHWWTCFPFTPPSSPNLPMTPCPLPPARSSGGTYTAAGPLTAPAGCPGSRSDRQLCWWCTLRSHPFSFVVEGEAPLLACRILQTCPQLLAPCNEQVGPRPWKERTRLKELPLTRRCTYNVHHYWASLVGTYLCNMHPLL